MAADLNEKMQEVRELLDQKGFSSNIKDFWEKLALIHSEISEAADAYRKGKSYEVVGEELIDTLVRILDLLSVLQQDPEELFKKIMDNNRKRPPRWNTKRGG